MIEWLRRVFAPHHAPDPDLEAAQKRRTELVREVAQATAAAADARTVIQKDYDRFDQRLLGRQRRRGMST